ncbi:MAG: helix-turn-helix domain-containing protein [Solirubrobacterales bacterium]
MISYKPFQKILIDRELKKTEFMKIAGISGATMAKLSSKEYVSLEVIDKLCAALNCQPGDLIEYIPDEKTEKKSTNTKQPRK